MMKVIPCGTTVNKRRVSVVLIGGVCWGCWGRAEGGEKKRSWMDDGTKRWCGLAEDGSETEGQRQGS